MNGFNYIAGFWVQSQKSVVIMTCHYDIIYAIYIAYMARMHIAVNDRKKQILKLKSFFQNHKQKKHDMNVITC